MARLDWRKYLTPEEREVIRKVDKAKREWRILNAVRAGIVNRAIQRAKYRAAAGRREA